MTPASAITIAVAPEQVLARLAEAESPLSDGDAVEISTAPAPGDRGTELRVRWTGAESSGIAQKVAAVFGSDTQRQLDDALRRFKQLVETGEVLRSDGSPDGVDATAQRNQQPAQPADRPDPA